jgi:CRP-like cAMP-binding protein
MLLGMSQELSLHQRRRKPLSSELDGIPWWPVLLPIERENVARVLLVGDAEPGDYVCRTGRPPTYWFGVVDGLLKMNTESADGVSMTLAGLPPGGWFGEGTVIKREPIATTCRPSARPLWAACP